MSAEEIAAVQAWFTELTGIREEQLLRASNATFKAALAAFIAFCGVTPVRTMCQDWFVMRQNCALYDINEIPALLRTEFERVKPQLAAWGLPAAELERNPSSGELYRAVKLSVPELYATLGMLAGGKDDQQVHNALHDVRSMAVAVPRLTYITTAL
jgi:hypothetical protein